MKITAEPGKLPDAAPFGSEPKIRRASFVVLLLLTVAIGAELQARDFNVERAYLEDQSRQLTLSQVQKMPFRVYAGILSRGYGPSVLWLRLKLDPGAGLVDDARPGSGDLILRVLPGYLDEIRLFDSANSLGSRVTGDRYRPDPNGYPSLDLNFVLSRGSGSRYVWLRIATTSTRLLRVEATSYPVALRADRTKEFLSTGYLALLLLTVLWAGAKLFLARDRVIEVFLFQQTIIILWSSAQLGYFRVLLGPLLPEGFLDIATSLLVVSSTSATILFDIGLLREYRPPAWSMRSLKSLLVFYPIEIALLMSDHAWIALKLNAATALILGFLVVTAAALAKPGTGEDRPAIPKAILVSVLGAIVVVIVLTILALLGVAAPTDLVLNGTYVHGLTTGILMIGFLEIRAFRMKKRQDAALRASEQRWGFALEGSGDGVWDWNPVTNAVFYSERFNALLGHEEDPLPPNHQEWMTRIHPDDVELVEASVQTHLAGGSASCKSEHRIRCKDGTYHWFSARGLLVERDDEGQPLRMIGTLRDITARKEAEVELRESRDRLAAANLELAQAAKMKNELLASVSHELRTPLGAVLGMASLLHEHPPEALPPDARAQIELIDVSGRELLGLINDVIDVARFDAGKIDVEFGPCLVSEAAEAAARRFKFAALEKRQRISVSVIPPGIVLETDGERLTQLLRCLISNAIKFTPDGGKAGIDIVGDRESGSVQITVWDTGIGIPPDKHEQIFELLDRLDTGRERSYSGLGLGLPLVRRISHLLGGKMRVESVPGQGSRFILELPWPSREVSVCGGDTPEALQQGSHDLIVVQDH